MHSSPIITSSRLSLKKLIQLPVLAVVLEAQQGDRQQLQPVVAL